MIIKEVCCTRDVNNPDCTWGTPADIHVAVVFQSTICSDYLGLRSAGKLYTNRILYKVLHGESIHMYARGGSLQVTYIR